MNPGTTIHVVKGDHNGHETWRYEGTLLARGPSWLQLEAFFAMPDKDSGFVVFRRGDRFVEWYYTDRWYNIFQVHDGASGPVKGWYCNITRPVRIVDRGAEMNLTWPDLALDLWISSTGDVILLDEDEFAALEIDAETRAAALLAVDDLRARVARREAPFDVIGEQDAR